MTDEEIVNKAIAQAKAMKKSIAKIMIDHLPEEESAVSVFMAGSPGAGKTETAKSIISQFKKEHGVEVVHIENDELRKEFEDYKGLNSPLFQDAATRLVEAIHDRALKKKVSFLLDSTLSSFEKAKSNIERSLKRDRYVLIIFVYQDPEQAWCLVKARETVEGRRVPPEVFVDQFLKSQAVVSELKKIFKDQIDIIFMEKNLDGTREKPYFNVSDIDSLLGKKYNRASLEAIAGIGNST
ncbi:zeta toxin family protein [Pseudoalteromonas ruthenica]|uniref:zeta toxin family protein n=1 Tax=Pseudoalteromonas ruthenica TaxID=151081 RepID=UPI00241CD4AA|nr:zeta toxin family protein [Pseudoalteromonas ruthenica]|tara:strand:+ start:41546 stop:42262 length:717 start_codon:yes stop_codon:yes gene_type:complete